MAIMVIYKENLSNILTKQNITDPVIYMLCTLFIIQ